MSEQLINDFESHEVATAEELLECMHRPPSAAKFRRTVMLLLRGHYSHPDNYGDEYAHLRCFRYAPDKSSTLHVGFTHLPQDENPDNYPGIYVGFGGVQLTQLAIGNVAGYTDDSSGTHLAKQADLTLVINHVAKEAGDAYELADMSAMILTAMGTPVAMKSGASSFEVEGYAEPKKEVPSPDRYYTVAMTVKISYTHAVTRSVESHRIRRIAILTDHS